MRRAGAALSLAAASAATIVGAGTADAVDTDIAISTTAIDFGQVDVGSSATASVTLTNTGGDPFGPINMFGGAPPSAEFNASQNCQATTLPAGGSCSVTYSFSPGATGPFNDTSSFTVSETASQSDGEDFSVSLTGTGFDPNATTTTTEATTTSTSTTVVDTTTTPPTTASTGNGANTGTAPPAPPTASVTTSSTSTTSTTLAPLGGLPLTGVAVPRPAIVVKVDNVDSEPQAGLNQADVVFEEIVEGSATRFAAVFNSVDAGQVGPVRSARTTDVDLALALGDPAMVLSGANDRVQQALLTAGIELIGEGAPGLVRRPDLTEPHNLFADLRQIWPQLTSSGDAAPIFGYAAPGSPETGTPVSFTEMRVGAYDVRWDWDPGAGVFLRSQLGHPHALADGRASTDNVVVLVTEYTVVDDSPEAHTVGSGRAVVYLDGRRIEGTWRRETPTSPFTLEADGQPILLTPGRTWVELVSSEHELTDG
jgi:hypothetical protein